MSNKKSSMKLSLTSWSLRACSLDEAAAISNALGIGALDLGYFFAPALDRAALLADPAAVATRVRELPVAVPNFYHLFGDSLVDRNLANPAALKQNLQDFRQVAKFCKLAGIPTIFVVPGIVNPGQSRRDALVHSAQALGELQKIAADAGVILTFEPHVHSITESPSIVLELLERIPGLKLTLDYAHFICMGWRQDEIDPLAAHAAHVHLRQARPGALQTKSGEVAVGGSGSLPGLKQGGEGVINMEAQFATLRDAGYAGALSLEFVHMDYMAILYDDVLTETVSMRDRFLVWAGEA